ncbi:unnamed protein product, partial [Prorocentrum cordatum]
GHARVRRQGRRRPRLPRDGAPAEGGPACERREEGDHGQLSEDLAARRARHVPSYPMMAGDEDLEAPAHQQPSRARRVASLNRLFKAHEERQREEMAQRRRELQEERARAASCHGCGPHLTGVFQPVTGAIRLDCACLASPFSFLVPPHFAISVRLCGADQPSAAKRLSAHVARMGDRGKLAIASATCRRSHA